jgi:predicted XRE-type DNA-binding protein
MKEPIHESSGNIFIDLGFAEAEATVLQMRADLMIDLQQFIAQSSFTQAQIAKKLGITQTRVSDLVRNKWEKFNLETLITLEARAGRKVTLELAA